MKYQHQTSTPTRRPSAAGACDGVESTDSLEATDTLELEAPKPVANLRAIKAVPTATAANAETMNRIVWLVSGPLESPLLPANKPSSTPPTGVVGKPRSTPSVGTGVGEGLVATEPVGAAVSVEVTWGAGVGEGLIATASIGATVPVGTAWGVGVGEGLVATESIGATVPVGTTKVGVGIGDVTAVTGIPLGTNEAVRISSYAIDMDIDMDVGMSSS
jgi:hypothetical protein